MTWYKRSDSEYEAIGEQGTFSVWCKNGVWRARYWAHNKSCLLFLSPCKNSAQCAMKTCEEDVRWEKHLFTPIYKYTKIMYKGV